MFMPVFARNPIEHEKFSSLHIAMVGAGSIGGALFDILVRTGAASFSVIDPEDFAPENVGRHVLTASSVGKPKVEELAKHALSINPDCRVQAIKAKFHPEIIQKPPDLIISTADSFQAASLVNGYALRHNIPAVFGGVWGEASVAEIMYVIPGKTPCYECYAGFRRNVEIPKDERRYTDPNYDDTRIPGQAGLWANILIVAGLQFQVVLGLVGLRDSIRFAGNVWFMNISDPHCAFQPLTLTVGEVKKGCAVCDEALLEEFRNRNLAEDVSVSDVMPPSPVKVRFDFAELSDRIWAMETGACSLALKTRRERRLQAQADPNEKPRAETPRAETPRAVCSPETK